MPKSSRKIGREGKAFGAHVIHQRSQPSEKGRKEPHHDPEIRNFSQDTRFRKIPSIGSARSFIVAESIIVSHSITEVLFFVS
jgi:hypothetical protein